MTNHDSKQAELKDAAVTQYYENSEDARGEVLETRYAGEHPDASSIERLGTHFLQDLDAGSLSRPSGRRCFSV